MDSSFLVRMGDKIPMEGVIKFGAEPEGMTIQRLPHLGIYLINNHQTQTLGRCQQEPVRLCQCLANTEVDVHSHALDRAQGPQ